MSGAALGVYDWLFWLAGAAIGTAGAALLVWALCWDRSRGLSRCAKCWYDMGGVPGLVCPECGKDAVDEKSLHKRRRRWGIAAIAAALGCIGYGMGVTPQVLISGWPGIVPTTALIIALPWIERPTDERQQGYAAGTIALNPSERLFMDLRRNRVDKARIWGWQRRLLYERVLAGDPDSDEEQERWWKQFVGYVLVLQAATDLTDRQRFKLMAWWAPYLVET